MHYVLCKLQYVDFSIKCNNIVLILAVTRDFVHLKFHYQKKICLAQNTFFFFLNYQ